MANKESAGVKKEKRTTDNNDDPFGELDWKDGIATLPGNVTLKNSVTDFYRLPRIFIFTDFYRSFNSQSICICVAGNLIMAQLSNLTVAILVY